MTGNKLLLRVLVRLTQPPVLTAFASLHALGMIAVAARYLASLHGTTDAAGHVVTGDFPAFLTAARMLDTGQGAALYDLAAQRSAQEAMIGRALDVWQPYAYPPLLGVALLPAARWSYLTAFCAHDAVMAVALVLLLWQLWSLLPSLRETRQAWWAVALLVVSFHPVARTVMGGQNTVLSLALLAGFVVSARDGRQGVAGICLGLLTYKPQLVPLLALCALLRRQWRLLAAAGLVAVAHYAIGALFAGPQWPLAWLRMLDAYRGLEWASNRYTHVSLWALAAQLLPAAWAFGIALAGSLLVITLVVRRARDRSLPLTDLFALALAATVLVSPHVQYYDVALLLLPVLIALEARKCAGVDAGPWLRLSLALGYVLFPLYTYGPQLGVQPLCLWALACFGWLLLLAQTKGAAGASAGLRSTSSKQGK
jgi:hypothetical protein